jgi:hypothetical protein
MSMPIPRPGERVEAVEIAGELRAKIESVACSVMKLLREETQGPKEGLIVLHFVTEHLKAIAGIKAVQAVIETGGEN